ncbi:MAG: glycosyltransferase family 4 protein [Candidatus Latescibacterota bacterium]|nr:glycosyltransferase family 4 protein [Candidatus Latescibacterota bacterium]
MKRNRILYLARRYPPSLGGIQTFSYKLWEHVSQSRQVRLHALGREHLAHLGWFLPTAYLASLIDIVRGVDLVYFSDGVIACLAPYLRPFTKVPFVTTIHGLEITYSGGPFSRMISRGVKTCDRICAVSETTAELIEGAGVSSDRIRIAYNGIEPPLFTEQEIEPARAELESQLGLKFHQDRVLLNVGRQIPRKGIATFIEKGFPLLEDDIQFVICGTGPDHERIKEVARNLGASGRIHVLGHVENIVSATLRDSCDLFLMPNVRYPNDVEGYGIAPLEAMYDGLPVVAFAVDALVESCREGGYLVPEDDYQAFADQIHHYLTVPIDEKETLRQQARAYIRRENAWCKTGDTYLQIFDEL